MANKENFDNAISNITGRKYYHGSKRVINGDYLQPRQAFNSVQNGVVLGAFITSDIKHAKFFAINSCIGEGQTKKEGKKLYLERLAAHIRPNFFVYTVYETQGKEFIHDCGTEYYSTEPIKIAECEKYYTAKEIEDLGYEIYVLDEPLKSKTSYDSGNNIAVREEMEKAIKQHKFHRVDIAKIIELQSKNIFQREGKE